MTLLKEANQVAVLSFCVAFCRYGGSVRGDDETCSLPTTMWSGPQAHTPSTLRRLGPLGPSPNTVTPHPGSSAKQHGWVSMLGKLVLIGAVVAASAAGVVKVIPTNLT